MFALLRHCRKLDLPIDICLELFDRMVVPILTYGCEVWGYEDLGLLERLHLKFCKILLKLSKYTASCMLYNELGRFPMETLVKSRLINFWAKIVCTDVYEEKWCSLLK